jgi:hypothetical protein
VTAVTAAVEKISGVVESHYYYTFVSGCSYWGHPEIKCSRLVVVVTLPVTLLLPVPKILPEKKL